MKGHESSTLPSHHHHGQQNRLPPTCFSHAVEHVVKLNALALATWYFDCIYMNSIKFLHGPVSCYLQEKTHFLESVSSCARQASFSSTALTQFTPWSIRLSSLLRGQKWISNNFLTFTRVISWKTNPPSSTISTTLEQCGRWTDQ